MRSSAAFLGVALTAAALTSCVTPPGVYRTESLASLPVALSNNAVAAVDHQSGVTLYSFLGLESGKSFRDVTSKAYRLAPASDRWQSIPAPPGPGRLAATAVAVGETVYLFGGYTVAKDGTEKSIETVHALDTTTQTYRAVSPMPVPVDDAMSVVYQQRYIYLISGWHDTGNVNLVQAYDTVTDQWFQSTPYPGAPVFGHAGGLVDNQMVVCGGVSIQSTAATRKFVAERACYRGKIDAKNPRRIDWTTLDHPPGPALYRAGGVGAYGAVWLIGGSDNPYNYNGIGYDGQPSAPQPSIWSLDIARGQWRLRGTLSDPPMDLRGLLVLGHGKLAVVGGMRSAQQVSASAFTVDVGEP